MFTKKNGVLVGSVVASAAATTPCFAAGAGDYTDVVAYATTNVPLAISAVIGLLVLFMALPLAKGVFRNVKSLLAGLR